MSVQLDIIGDERIKRVMRELRTTAHRRVMTSGAAEASKQLAKDIKADIPSRHKTIRKSVHWRRLKAKEAPDGGAKAGGRVGKASKERARGATSGRKGVGIGGRNISWWIRGSHLTPNRMTGKRGGPVRRTGEMPPQTRPVWVYAMRGRGKLQALWRKGAFKQLQKEIQKGKAFA